MEPSATLEASEENSKRKLVLEAQAVGSRAKVRSHRPARAGTVVITGASAGVGRTAARAFAARGSSVALVARGRDGLEAAAKEIDAAGGRALVLPADVADEEAVEAAASAAEDQLGPIDVWVNNAMASVFSPVAELTAAEVRRVTDVTYLGYVYGTLSAL